MILAPDTDVAVLESEIVDGLDADDARRMVTIYGELLAFHQSRWTRLAAARNGSDLDERVAHQHLVHIQARLASWQLRHRQLAGIRVDMDRRILTNGSEAALLTKRELQLLDFLLQRPDRHHSATTLAAQAWHDPRLAAEQVRTYVVRLRRLLLKVGAPCQISTQRRLGYRLTSSGERPS
jgi:DNA-binding response OmpR family regulator